jgi:hypothetical protein
MPLDELRNLYNQEQRIDADYPDTRREVTGHTIRHVLLTDDTRGWVLWSDLTEECADAAIEQEIGVFRALGCDFEWKVYDYDRPADLPDRLLARGFAPRLPADAIMVLDLGDVPDVLRQPVPASIRRITAPEDVPAVMGVLAVVWDEDFSALGDTLAWQLEHTPETLSLYAAFVEGRPVSVAWGQFMARSQFVGLWGGSTLAEYRKQGLYTGLLSVRAREAQARGKRFLTVDASPMSRPILERFGFVHIGTATDYSWECAQHTSS